MPSVRIMPGVVVVRLALAFFVVAFLLVTPLWQYK
jgi:hypothetical protein